MWLSWVSPFHNVTMNWLFCVVHLDELENVILPLWLEHKYLIHVVHDHGYVYFKGITPVLPIFREGILNGSPEMKEQAAIGLGELINLTSAEALKPSVVNITGPLIRILGDRFTSNVKVAVLETLTLLLAKVCLFD